MNVLAAIVLALFLLIALVVHTKWVRSRLVKFENVHLYGDQKFEPLRGERHTKLLLSRVYLHGFVRNLIVTLFAVAFAYSKSSMGQEDRLYDLAFSLAILAGFTCLYCLYVSVSYWLGLSAAYSFRHERSRRPHQQLMRELDISRTPAV